MISIIASGSNHVYNSSTSCFMSMVMELKCVFCFSWSKYGDPLFQCFMILHTMILVCCGSELSFVKVKMLYHLLEKF